MNNIDLLKSIVLTLIVVITATDFIRAIVYINKENLIGKLGPSFLLRFIPMILSVATVIVLILLARYRVSHQGIVTPDTFDNLLLVILMGLWFIFDLVRMIK